MKLAFILTTSISNVQKQASILTTSLFQKKKNETGWGRTTEDDFTFNVVLPHEDLILFRKKISTDPILQIDGQKDLEIQKKPL